MLTVNLIRVGRQELYKLVFSYDPELVDNIKKLSTDQRDWSMVDKIWSLTAIGVQNLALMYKGRKDIKFEFENEKQKEQFQNIIKKHKHRLTKKLERISNLDKLNAEILDYKRQLPELAKGIDYSKYLKEGVVPMPHQIEGALLANKLSQLEQSTLLAMDLGTGKCQKLTDLVLTPGGYKLMGDIEVGDEIINSQGRVSKINGVFPQGEKDIYKITFSDNTSTECCDQHLWTVQTSNHKKRNHGWFTYTLREIMNMGIEYNFKSGKHSKWFIPIVKPIEFTKKDLNIHPYVMGCLLGDGSLASKNSTTFTSKDEEIITSIGELLPDNHIIKEVKSSKYGYSLIHKHNKGKTSPNGNIINSFIKEYSLNQTTSHTKFIPNEFKFSSIEDRILILQGLMDTDGTVDMSANGCSISYTSVSLRLIEDLQFVVQSLGGTGKIRKQKIDKNGFKSYSMTISLPPDIIPFKLKRKLNFYKPKSKYLPYRKIKKIEYVGKAEAQCISVDADDHLYLTNDCIVTHNTLTAVLAAMMDYTVENVLFIVPANLRLNIQNEVEKFTNEKAYVVQAAKDKKQGGYRLTKYKRNKGHELEDCKFIIMNYDYFSSTKFDANEKISGLGLHNIDMIIFDEAHYLTNTKSNRSVNIKKSFDGLVEKYIALTATPLKSNVTKFFPLLKMLKPDTFTNENDFNRKYCGLVYEARPETGWPGWKQIGITNFEGLYQEIQHFTYRVKKEDVLKDLPPILINKILIEMTPAEQKEYSLIEDGFKKVDWESGMITSTDDEDSDAPIVILMRLRQYTATLKIKKALELIKELNEIGEKVILFDAFKKPLYTLKSLLGSDTKLYSGDQTAEQKQDLVDEFQESNNKLMNLLISLMAGNAGITLTKAKNVIQTTLSYVPSENSQAYGRAHRIGQDSQVTVWLPIIVDTVDEIIYDILQDKEKVIKAVVDGEEHVDDSEVSVLSDVFSKMKQRYGN